MDFISKLPPEITRLIISFLDIHALRVCRKVSKAWRETVDCAVSLKDRNDKVQKNWKEGYPVKNVLQIQKKVWDRRYCWLHQFRMGCLHKNSLNDMLASDLTEAIVTETDNFMRVYDISNSNLSDDRVALKKQIHIETPGECFAMDIDKDVFVYAFSSQVGSPYLRYSQIYFKVLERKTWKEMQTSNIRPSNENIPTNEMIMPSGRLHLKLFGGFLMFCCHKRLHTTSPSIELYRKICKRNTHGIKFMFQHLKTMRNVRFIEANQLDREHLILRAQGHIHAESYEYLQLDVQFPISFHAYQAKEHCHFYKILGPTDFGKLENVRRFAIHHRITICAMSYPFIVYYFEDIDSIQTEMVDGEMIFIEDTILQVYDLKKNEQVKSFRIQDKNYIKCVKADAHHFVIEIKNSYRDRIASHKYESDLWIWSTKDIFNPNIDRQISMEIARRIINIQICVSGSEFKMFFSNDIQSVEETKKCIPGFTFHNKERRIESFELASITQNYLSAYITGYHSLQEAPLSRTKLSQLVFIDFGF